MEQVLKLAIMFVNEFDEHFDQHGDCRDMDLTRLISIRNDLQKAIKDAGGKL